MARGVNKVIIVGNLGRDPEVRYTPNGSAVANVTIATSEQWKDKQSGENKDKTEWHRVVFFNRLAEIVSEYLKKGSQIYIEGSLRTNKWQDQSGNDRYTTEIIAREMQMLGGRTGGSGSGMSGSGSAGFDQGMDQSQPPSNTNSAPDNNNADNKKTAGGAYDDFDDDIPF